VLVIEDRTSGISIGIQKSSNRFAILHLTILTFDLSCQFDFAPMGLPGLDVCHCYKDVALTGLFN
jgi:hypothetical protein